MVLPGAGAAGFAGAGLTAVVTAILIAGEGNQEHSADEIA